MENSFIIYFKKLNGAYHILDMKTKQVSVVNRLPSRKLKDRQFTLLKGYDANDDGLKKYANDIINFCEELSDENNKKKGIIPIDYLAYYSDNLAVERTFKRFCKRKYESLKLDTITYLEDKWSNKCYNAGLFYCDKEGDYDSYGYDFKSFYPSLLASSTLLIPTKIGQEVILKELPEKLQVGYYNVNILSTHSDVKKVFSFSKDNVYTHISLAFAIKHKAKFDFKIDLLHGKSEQEFNAYVYKDEDCVSARSIFAP